jgi:hypothetical protein
MGHHCIIASLLPANTRDRAWSRLYPLTCKSEEGGRMWSTSIVASCVMDEVKHVDHGRVVRARRRRKGVGSQCDTLVREKMHGVAASSGRVGGQNALEGCAVCGILILRGRYRSADVEGAMPVEEMQSGNFLRGGEVWWGRNTSAECRRQLLSIRGKEVAGPIVSVAWQWRGSTPASLRLPSRRHCHSYGFVLHALLLPYPTHFWLLSSLSWADLHRPPNPCGRYPGPHSSAIIPVDYNAEGFPFDVLWLHDIVVRVPYSHNCRKRHTV